MGEWGSVLAGALGGIGKGMAAIGQQQIDLQGFKAKEAYRAQLRQAELEQTQRYNAEQKALDRTQQQSQFDATSQRLTNQHSATESRLASQHAADMTHKRGLLSETARHNKAVEGRYSDWDTKVIDVTDGEDALGNPIKRKVAVQIHKGTGEVRPVDVSALGAKEPDTPAKTVAEKRAKLKADQEKQSGLLGRAEASTSKHEIPKPSIPKPATTDHVAAKQEVSAAPQAPEPANPYEQYDFDDLGEMLRTPSGKHPAALKAFLLKSVSEKGVPSKAVESAISGNASPDVYGFGFVKRLLVDVGIAQDGASRRDVAKILNGIITNPTFK